MEHDAYVATLLAILTNPDPPGVDPRDPFRQSTDGIDRVDGFGTEVRVASIGRVPGRYGEELEVGFVLEVPPDETRVPAEGTVRVPFDAQWRRLSGYEDPAVYAPVVASRVWWAANDHVRMHRVGGVPEPPGHDEAWRRLMASLTQDCSVTETGPGRAELRVGGRVVTVVVAPDETLRDPDRTLRDPNDEVSLDFLDDEERYLVAWEGSLHASTRAELPPVRGRARERRARDARGRGGAWYAHRPGTAGR